MKKALLVPLLYVALCGQAQQISPHSTQSFAKRAWLVGLQAGRGGAVLIGQNLTAHVYGGYFLTNQLLVGLNATRIQEGLPSAHDVGYLLGPLIRFQFTRTRISPFLLASGQIGRHNIIGFAPLPSGEIIGLGPPARLYSRLFGAGLSIRVLAALRVDLGLTWQDRVSDAGNALRSVDGLYQAQISLNYGLGHPK